MKLDILAIAAHPDDVELACSGTLIKHIQAGKKVGVLDLTRGELGTRGTAEERDQEAKKASEVMGIHVRENLGFRDGFFADDEAHQMEIIKVIRKFQPEIVLCNAPSDRHIDHGKASGLATKACFLSGLLKIETNCDGRAQQAWRPQQVYHYIQDYYHQPDFVIDISEQMDNKLKSILAYKTQFYSPDNEGPETPISSKDFLYFLEARARSFGRIIQVTFGEGFIVQRPVGVKLLSDLT